MVDVVLIALMLFAAVQGLRLGAVVQVASFGSFVLGLYLGALLAPYAAESVRSAGSRSTVALATIVTCGIVFGIAGHLISSAYLRRVTTSTVAHLDRAVGGVVAVIATLVVTWLLANTLVSSSFVTLNAAIANSRIVRAMDDVMPAPPAVFSRVQGFLAEQGFPSVFAQMAPISTGTIVLPGAAVLDRAVNAAGPSTVKIQGDGCGEIIEGSGFVAAPGIVVTNAHVVAGVAHPTVQDGLGVHAAQVIEFDPNFDMAILRVPTLTDPALTLDPGMVRTGQVAAVLGYPGGGPFTAGAAGVLEIFDAEGRNIYGTGLTQRTVYELQAVVRPGNSGGPLVEPDGQVVGMVFSRSTTNDDVGYALTSPDLLQRLLHSSANGPAVSTGACTGG